MYPGGQKEQLLTKYGENRLYLSGRKGFVKLALEEGAHLVPVYAFGEVNLFHHSSFLLEFRKFILARYGATIPLVYGAYGLLPYQQPITMVFGKPIVVKQVTNPTQNDIDSLHKTYCKELVQLFNDYKNRCGYPNAELIID